MIELVERKFSCFLLAKITLLFWEICRWCSLKCNLLHPVSKHSRNISKLTFALLINVANGEKKNSTVVSALVAWSATPRGCSFTLAAWCPPCHRIVLLRRSPENPLMNSHHPDEAQVQAKCGHIDFPSRIGADSEVAGFWGSATHWYMGGFALLRFLPY